MDDRETRRLALSGRVGTLLRTNEEFRAFVRFVAPDGSRPIVVAMLDDRVGPLFDHVEHHHPHGANVLVGGDANFVNLVMRPVENDTGRFGSNDTDCPVNVDSELGMLIAYVLLHRGEPIQCRPVKLYEVDLLEEELTTG